MVAMQVGQEDGLQVGEVEPCAAQSHLCTFRTVEHEEFFADVDHLCRTESARGGQGCTASKDIDFKFFHVLLLALAIDSFADGGGRT